MLLLAAAVGLALGLPADLDRILAAPTLRGAHVGVLVEPAGGGPPLYARGADATIQPASTLKLVVGSMALDRLGPAYRFTTVLAQGAGDALILHGGGDPLLRGADLDAAADAVASAGITRAQITLDESHVVPDERRAPGWSVDDILQYYAPVVDGLPFEENVLAVTLVPGAAIGLPPAVQLPPPFVPLTASACSPGPTLLTFTVAARTVAAGQPDTSDVVAGPCGDVVVTGEVPLGAPSHVDAAVDQPDVLALRYFAAALQQRGVSVLAQAVARRAVHPHAVGRGAVAARRRAARRVAGRYVAALGQFDRRRIVARNRRRRERACRHASPAARRSSERGCGGSASTRRP